MKQQRPKLPSYDLYKTLEIEITKKRPREKILAHLTGLSQAHKLQLQEYVDDLILEYADEPAVEQTTLELEDPYLKWGLKLIKPKETKSFQSFSIIRYTLNDLLHPNKKDPLNVGLVKMSTSDPTDPKPFLDDLTSVTKKQTYDLIVAPEYTFHTVQKPLTEEEVSKYIKHLAALTTKNTAIIPGTFIYSKKDKIWNKTFVLNDGTVKFSYAKMTDCGETIIANRYSKEEHTKNKKKYQAVFGNSTGIFNTLWDWKSGIEICADTGTLSKNNVTDLDIYFLISCGNTSVNMDVLKTNKYGFIVDGCLRECRCYQKIS